MTLEKNGSIQLTPDDMREYNSGLVSKRIQDLWGLTFSELKAIIEEKNNNETLK